MSKQTNTYIVVIPSKHDKSFDLADKINSDSFYGLKHSSVDSFWTHYNIECEVIAINRFIQLLNSEKIDTENNYFAEISVDI